MNLFLKFIIPTVQLSLIFGTYSFNVYKYYLKQINCKEFKKLFFKVLEMMKNYNDFHEKICLVDESIKKAELAIIRNKVKNI